MKIRKPAAAVFEAIVDPQKMANYFISAGSGRLESGKTVSWHWADVGAELTVVGREIVEGKRIGFQWSATGRETTVDIELAPAADVTLVKVTERGWKPDAEGIARYGEQMQGWANMLTSLKAYLEYGINLRV